jgi:hypothetical protein
MVHKGKVRYRRWDVGRPKKHYLQVAYRDNKLIEATLKAYKGSGLKDIPIVVNGKRVK